MPSKQQLSLSYLSSQSGTESALRGGETGFYLAEGFAGLSSPLSAFRRQKPPTEDGLGTVSEHRLDFLLAVVLLLRQIHFE